MTNAIKMEITEIKNKTIQEKVTDNSLTGRNPYTEVWQRKTSLLIEITRSRAVDLEF